MSSVARRFSTAAARARAARHHLLWLLAIALPLVLVACNKSGGGSGY